MRSGMDRGVRGTAHSGFSITSSDSFSKDNRFYFNSVEPVARKNADQNFERTLDR